MRLCTIKQLPWAAANSGYTQLSQTHHVDLTAQLLGDSGG